MIESDPRFEVKWGDDRSFRRLVEKVPSAADQPLVPLGPILVLHEQDRPLFVEPRFQPGGMKQHERHQSTGRRRAASWMRTKQMAEIRCVLAEIRANGCLTLGGAVAFIEDEVKDLMNGVEPLDKLRGVGRLERDVMCGELARGSLEPLFDGFLADQERAGNFGHSETAQGLEGEGELVFARKSGWQHAKIILS